MASVQSCVIACSGKTLSAMIEADVKLFLQTPSITLSALSKAKFDTLEKLKMQVLTS